MVSERLQRRIDALLDEADEAAGRKDWVAVAEAARRALALDAGSDEARAYLAMGELQEAGEHVTGATVAAAPLAVPEKLPLPTSFASGRYRVLRLLGEGGRKRVYLARDERLGREVAFAVIGAEGLDAMGRERVQREAQAMARLGSHPNVVAIHDIGEDGGDVYMVQEYLGGGDTATLLKEATSGLPIERVLEIANGAASGLDFIHKAGLIHRDVKPANLFLAADGTAKVGDFGLAMAMDLSRLTQHGTFIGTVAYMAPEQAVGGDVDARSDLYSLGCVLYELVTGRVPFVGDGPTAVISQHLNTPPVAPSWHREDCPPSLERLIVSLLEKDPQKRPQDASTLLNQLGAVDPHEQPRPRSEGHALGRLARGVFVGRGKELERLRSALDEALSGHGGLVMLVGEPGIGKTRTAQELETYARMRGAQVLWGRSHEQSGAPAFWPWIQVGGQWGQGNDLTSLTPLVASGGNELVRLFSVVRTVPGFVEPPPMADGAAAQFRLFDAYAGFVRFVSEQKPLVITLDDLHWSDKPTLLLLQHLARELARMRCLVVCTYRDTDLVRTHPLSEALAGLNRDPGFERIVLRGLERDEVRNYIAAAANLEPSPALVDRVYEETEGNPFFLAEVVNLLTQEGTLSTGSLSDIRIPDGVKEALGRRLDRLSEEANELLQVAAVVGREFAYDTLQLLHTGDADSLLKLIEEGLGARVIEEMPQPGRYRFTHALMQETLLGELSTTRRVRLHGQVGEALEKRWGARAEEFASRLANHFSESATLTEEHAEKAFRYLKLAGEQAEASFAWAEAVELYKRALTSPGASASGGDEEHARLQVRLAQVGHFGGDLRLFRHALSAAEQFRKLGDATGFAEAVFVAASNALAWGTPEIRSLVREALNLLGDSNPLLQGRILSTIPGIESEAHVRLAQALASRHDIPELTGRLRSHAGMAALWADDLELASSEYLKSAEEFDRAGHFGESALSRFAYAGCAQWAGELDLALSRVADVIDYHERHHINIYLAECLQTIAEIGVARSQVELVQRLRDSKYRNGVEYLVEAAWTAYSSPEQAAAIIARESPRRPAPVVEARVLEAGLLAHYLAGPLDSARSRLSDWMAARRRDRNLWFPVNFTPVWPAFPALADAPDLAEVYEFLATIRNHKTGWWESLDATRGDIALRLGRVDDAERWYQAGLDWAERERCPVPAGRNLEGLGEVAVARDDTQTALAYLERAAERFRVGLAPAYVDRVVARRVELQGLADADPASSILATARAVQSEHLDLSPAASSDGTVTLMFSDIVDSTALNERLGDTAWMALLREHSAIVEREVSAHHGHVVKSMGDGFMVAFQSARDGLRCAIALQRAFTARNDSADQPIEARIGLHTGEAVRDHGDFFGKHVNLAARIGASAGGGEIVVSSLLAQLVEPSGEFALEAREARSFKGLEGEHVTFGVEWQ